MLAAHHDLAPWWQLSLFRSLRYQNCVEKLFKVHYIYQSIWCTIISTERNTFIHTKFMLHMLRKLCHGKLWDTTTAMRRRNTAYCWSGIWKSCSIYHMMVLNQMPNLQAIMHNHRQTYKINRRIMSAVSYHMTSFNDLVNFVWTAAASTNYPVIGKNALDGNQQPISSAPYKGKARRKASFRSFALITETSNN